MAHLSQWWLWQFSFWIQSNQTELDIIDVKLCILKSCHSLYCYHVDCGSAVAEECVFYDLLFSVLSDLYEAIVISWVGYHLYNYQLEVLDTGVYLEGGASIIYLLRGCLVPSFISLIHHVKLNSFRSIK